METGRRSSRRGAGACAAAVLGLLAAFLPAAGPAARAQSASGPADTAAIVRLNQEVAFSLFQLTSSGFTAGGHATYDDADGTSARFSIYSLPLRRRFQTEWLGPVEVRLTLSGGEAVTNARQDLGGGALVADRTLQATWNGRLDIGRPFALLPGLEFLPMAGIGAAHWTGKWTRRQAAGGAVPVPEGRVDFWTDALLYEAIGILEYTHRWRDLAIRPGLAVNLTHIDSIDGRAGIAARPGVPSARERAGLSGTSTLLRAALRVDGPLGLSLGATELRWQGFAVWARETTGAGLFPWSVEIGGALGADLGPVGRRWAGVDPGALFLGASYIVGENLQGVRANFGFRF